MMQRMCFFVWVIFASVAFAQEPSTRPSVIDVADDATLRANVGKEVVIEGDVSRAEWSRSGKVMNVRFKGTQVSRFQLALFERNKDRFNEAFSGNVAETLDGARIRVRGTVSLFTPRGEGAEERPQIILEIPNQITIVTPAPKVPTTKPAE